MTKIDIHIHSNNSDGVLSPKQIIDEAKQNGVKIISITDHDTVSSYSDDLLNYAKINGITLIKGVEISTKYNGKGVHILGYGFEINDVFVDKLEKIRNARHDYLIKVTKKLNELGYEVDFDKLNNIDAVTKAHISSDVVENKNNQKLLLRKFGHIPNRGEFIETIMNEGCPAYAEKLSISPKDASKIIRDAGGKVVVAHPVAYAHEDGLNERDIENLIEEVKPDGLETYYIYVDKFNNVFDECEKWTNLANKHNLLSTIGSDFHCDDGIRPLIGFSNFKLELSDDEINDILKKLK